MVQCKHSKHALISSALVTITLFMAKSTLRAPSPPRSVAFLEFQMPHAMSSGTDQSTVACDYSYGTWIKDEARAHYTEDCPFLDPGFRCIRNGRSDDTFRRWRWQPHRCDLPKFNATEMLERSRNRRIVFAGDSIGRNQWESLVCMLATAMRGPSRIYEQSGKPISKHKGYLSMVFGDYNLSVEYYRAPMLVMVDRFAANATKGGIKGAIRLDALPRHASRWAGADVLVLNTGHWWNKDKTIKAGNYFKLGNQLNKTIDIKDAFQLSLQTVKAWKLRQTQRSKSYFFFRSYAPSHYINGAWDTGGSCAHQHEPAASNNHSGEDYSWRNTMIAKMMEEMRSHGRKAQFLNITNMTELRKDGHPSGHREPGTSPDAPEDCSHWCLPGVPDTWNEVMYAQLLSMGYDTRRENG